MLQWAIYWNVGTALYGAALVADILFQKKPRNFIKVSTFAKNMALSLGALSCLWLLMNKYYGWLPGLSWLGVLWLLGGMCSCIATTLEFLGKPSAETKDPS